MTALWVTRAAFADLGLSDLAGTGAHRIRQRHPILEAFYSKRATSAIGQEKLQGIPSSAEIWNLHARDPYRGVT